MVESKQSDMGPPLLSMNLQIKIGKKNARDI